MKSKKWLALVLTLVFALSVGLTGCGDGKSTGKADKEQYLNLFLQDDVETLDSSKATDGYSGQVLAEVMEGLTRLENEGKGDKVVFTGAKEVKVSDDKLTYTFKLNDLKWSDDKPVTAQEYEYAWKRLVDPKTASEYAYLIYCIKGAEEFNTGKGKIEDVAVKAIDDKTLEVQLKSATPYFTQLTAFKNLLPLRKDKIEAAGEKYGQDASQLVYNGPFVIDQWVKGSEVILKKNEKYYDAKNVKLTKVNLKVVKEEQPRMQMFESKQIDASGARGEYRDKFKNSAESQGYQIAQGYIPSTGYNFFNANDKSKLFTNAKVRLAFSLAYDREDLVKGVFKRNYPAYGWAPYELLNGEKEYRKEVAEPLKEAAKKYPDPKALLKEGLKELGLDPEKQITVTYLSSGTDTFSRTIAEWYQQQWQNKLGVVIKIDAVNDFPQFLDKCDQGDFQIAGMRWTGDYNDPMTFFDMFTTGNGNNEGNWSNKTYDELVKKVAAESDYAKRLELFKQMEQILLVDDAGIAPTMYYDKFTFIQKYVKNLQQPLFGPDYEFYHAYTEGRE